MTYDGLPRATRSPPPCWPTASHGSAAASPRPAARHLAAGVEEPNALVQVDGPCPEPMLPATDRRALRRPGRHAPRRPGPARRRARPGAATTPMHAHCDVLVVGAGPAGLAAALAAGRTGARVILVDEQPELGGSLLGTRDDRRRAGGAVGRRRRGTARRRPEVRVLHRTTAFGLLRRQLLVLAERRTDHLGARAPRRVSRSGSGTSGRAGSCSPPARTSGRSSSPTTTGPGVMLAGAARTYLQPLRRRCPAAGRSCSPPTTAPTPPPLDLADAGVESPRSSTPARRSAAPARARRDARRSRCSHGHAVVGTVGEPRVQVAVRARR